MGLLVREFDQRRIKKVGGKSLPNRILYFDTETKQQEEGLITKHRMKMAWTCYVRVRRGKEKDTEKWRYWESPLYMQKYIESLTKDKTTLWVFGHNVFFDLQCSDFFYYFTRQGWVLDFYYDKGLTYILSIRKGKKKIKCISTTNYFPVSLKVLGETVGLHKIDVDFEGDTHEEIKRYCKRDVEIIKAGMEYYYRFIRMHSLGKLMLSRAGQAFGAFRHRFMLAPIHVHRDEEMTNFEKRSYFGGRVECRYIGEVKKGPFISLDVNSMYPYVMRNRMYPTRIVDYQEKPDMYAVRSALRRRCVVAKVYLETDEPAYPFRQDNKVIFPTGCFPAYLCTEGLDYALAQNHVIHIDAMATYEKGNIFTDYVDYFYELKKEYSIKGDKVMTRITKDFLNSLYGKFGQKSPCIEEEEDITCDGYYREVVYDMVTGKEEIITKLFNKRFIVWGEEPAKTSLVAIAAHVTEYARFHLYRLMQKVGLERVLYTDTDSLKMRKSDYEVLLEDIDNHELGALKVEEEFRYFTIHGPKDYETEHHKKAKSVPAHAEKLAEGEYTYTMFPKQDTHLRQGVTRYFITKQTTKKLKRIYTKGVVHENGTVTPLKIKIPHEPV